MPASKTEKSSGTTTSAALDLGQTVRGIWTYRDPRQQTLAAMVQATLNWDIQSFDAWLFESIYWRNYPRVRQRMIELRVHLSTVLLEPCVTPLQCETHIKNYFRTVRRLGMRLGNLPDNLRQNMLAAVNFKAAPASVKLDMRSVVRIQRLYRDRVQSGRKYGAQTELARQYGVSLATIRKVLQAEKVTCITPKLGT